MRYFQATTELFDALRQQVMQDMGMPSDFAAEPWPDGITCLALAEREYTPPQFAAMIEYAIANGGQEITKEQYDELQPKTTLP